MTGLPGLPYPVCTVHRRELVIAPKRPASGLPEGMTFRDPKQAFDEAIRNGTLSPTRGSPRYAGEWMYMHTEPDGDMFKNIETRKYLRSPHIG